MALHCTRGGLSWILGKFLPQKHCPVLAPASIISGSVSKNLGTWISGGHGSAGGMVELYDPGGIFQPKQFHNSLSYSLRGSYPVTLALDWLWCSVYLLLSTGVSCLPCSTPCFLKTMCGGWMSKVVIFQGILGDSSQPQEAIAPLLSADQKRKEQHCLSSCSVILVVIFGLLSCSGFIFLALGLLHIDAVFPPQETEGSSLSPSRRAQGGAAKEVRQGLC